ncbi:hypothetical protein V2J09_014918 [Rumex salicifolius]
MYRVRNKIEITTLPIFYHIAQCELLETSEGRHLRRSSWRPPEVVGDVHLTGAVQLTGAISPHHRAVHRLRFSPPTIHERRLPEQDNAAHELRRRHSSPGRGKTKTKIGN